MLRTPILDDDHMYVGSLQNNLSKTVEVVCSTNFLTLTKSLSPKPYDLSNISIQLLLFTDYLLPTFTAAQRTVIIVL